MLDILPALLWIIAAVIAVNICCLLYTSDAADEL